MTWLLPFKILAPGIFLSLAAARALDGDYDRAVINLAVMGLFLFYAIDDVLK